MAATGYFFSNTSLSSAQESTPDFCRATFPEIVLASYYVMYGVPSLLDPGGFPRNEEFHRSLKERYQDAYA
jgi:hypothetical protein